MDDQELVKIIQGHVDDGIGSESGELSNLRETIYNRYMGELYGNEKEGQSKATTREVLETIEWTMPALMRVFAGSDRVVEFEPDGPEDEQAAEQETDAVNYIIRTDNEWFPVAYTWIKSALMNPNSYVKSWRDESEQVTTEEYDNLDDLDLAKLAMDEEIEITAADFNEDGTYKAEVKRTRKNGRNVIDPLPEDEVVVDGNWAQLSLTDCPFVCHYPEKTHSDLLLMGYDESELDMAYSSESYSSEEENRRNFSDERETNDETHKALRKYRYHECFMLVDYDDDGIAERRRVVMIGNKIFENEETDEQPIVSAASLLMPHKHIGMSLAQIVLDLQDIKTFVQRQLMTNMARANNPRTIVLKGANIKDLLANRPNGIVRAKNVGDVTTEPVTPIINQVIPLLDLLDMQKETRTGISRNGLALTGDTLDKSAEGTVMAAIEKADQRIELLIRTFAECAIKPLMLKVHEQIIKHGDYKWIKSNGQWVQVNPSEWKKRRTMTCRVGTGAGDKRQKMFAANIITQDHDKIVAAGGLGTVINAQHIFNGRKLLVEAAGEMNVDKYYQNPDLVPPKPPQPPPPDPNMMLIQANQQIEGQKRQVEMAKLQQQGQIEYAQLQFKAAQSAREQQFKQIELEYKGEIERVKSAMTASKNQDDATNKALQTRIDELEIQLTSAQADEKLAMEKYKADLDSKTKLAIKEMDMQPADESQAEADIAQLSQIIVGMQQTIEAVNSPKEIVRDASGNPVGIKNTGTGEVRRIVKDDEGIPVGVE